VEPLGGDGAVEGLVRPRAVVITDPLVEFPLRRGRLENTRRVSNSARSARWNGSILPVVVGERGAVSRCLIPCSRQIASKRTSTGGWWNRPVNTRPLSVKTCSGAP
jgi:hypothetical protein